MKAVAKIFGVILLLVLLLIGAAATYLLTLFDPNDYKDEIQQLVKKQTNLELAIDGDLKLSLFPWLGVEINQLSLNTPDGKLAQVGRAELYAKTAPLFKGRVEISGISVEQLGLTLEVNQQGVGNWESIATKSSASAASPSTDAPSAVAFSLAALQVGQLAIEDATVSYQDKRDNSYHSLEKFNFRISAISLEDTFPLSTNFDYKNRIDAAAIPVSITSLVTPHLDQEGVELKELVVDLAKLRIAGDLRLSKVTTDMLATGKLQASNLNPSQWSAFLDQPALADINLPLDISTDFEFAQSSDTLALNNLKLEGPDIKASAQPKLTQLSSDMQYNTPLNLEISNLKAVTKLLGVLAPATADPKVLQTLKLNAQIKGSANALNLSGVEMQLDNTTLKGSLAITDFDKARISYNLTGNRLDLDRYLAPGAGDETSPSPSAEEAALLPLAAMRDLNMDASLTMEQLILSKVEIQNLSFKADSNQGLINLKQLQGNVYGGQFQLNGTLDARGTNPRIDIKQKLTAIEAAPILKTFADIDYISGKMNMETNLSTVGNLKSQLIANLNGNIKFDVAEGVFSGVDMNYMICDGIARIRRLEPSAAVQQPAKTPFESIAGEILINNGVATTPSFQIELQKMLATGQGTINLVQETLDYGIKVRITDELEDNACRVSENFRDIQWPIRCKGSLEQSPADYCRVDSEEMLKIAARIFRDDQLRKREGDIKGVLGEQLGDQLLDLLKKR